MNYTEIVKKYVPKNIKPERNTNLILLPVEQEQVTTICKELYTTHKLRLVTIKATDERKNSGVFKIFYVFAVPQEKYFLVPYLEIKNSLQFPSLVPHIHEASLYEREIHSFFGLKPVGHPDLRPFILHENWPSSFYPLRKDFNWKMRPKEAHEPYEFQKVSGEGIYEIPVGPIHAGIIEPGHFRFSVAGEEIIALEPQLGYVHKGSEKLFETLALPEKVKLSERISGDTSFSHSLAFCQAVETLGHVAVPERATYLRVIYSELERLANHFNDIGFILNDTAFAFGGSHGTRLREQIMRICEKITGHRFLRGVNVIGGVTKDISQEMILELQQILPKMKADFEEFVTITEDNESVLNRLKNTGILDHQVALDHGVVGIAARAVGIPRDVRLDFPYAAYPHLPVKLAKQTSGDVYARYWVRISESYNAIAIILAALNALPAGPIQTSEKIKLEKQAYTISMTEGWRGEIVYFIATNKLGTIDRVGVRDPSFLNWPAVPYAVAGNIVPDFPLINKSFNLSYSGFDR